MMWVEKYIGKKWTDENDCGYWFREIQKNEFGRDVPKVCVDHALPLDRVRAFKNKIPKEWQKTDKPKDGDAIFLSRKTRPHHIGVVVFINGNLRVLHALSSSNIVLSDKMSLKLNGWKMESFWTYGN